MAPNRQGDIARIAIRSLFAATIACFMTASIAGKCLQLVAGVSVIRYPAVKHERVIHLGIDHACTTRQARRMSVAILIRYLRENKRTNNRKTMRSSDQITRAQLLEAWLALTRVKCHENL